MVAIFGALAIAVRSAIFELLSDTHTQTDKQLSQYYPDIDLC